MLTHPDDLALLRWLDERESDDAPWLTRHLATCQACQQRFDLLVEEAIGLRATLALTHDELAVLERAALSSRVVAAAVAVRATPGHPWQLLGLFSLVMAMAAGWALFSPMVSLGFATLGQTVALSGLGLVALVRAVGLVLAWPGPAVGLGALSALGGVVLGLGLFALWSRQSASEPAMLSL